MNHSSLSNQTVSSGPPSGSKRASRKWSVSALLVIVLLVQLSCQALSGAPTATKAPAIAVPPTLAATATKALHATEAATPTTVAANETLPPASTPTESPTPAPEGFQNFDYIGFSMIVPSTWTVTEDVTDHVTLRSNRNALVFLATSQSEEQASTVDSIADSFIQSSASGKTVTKQPAFKVKLANNIEADAEDVQVKDSSGTTMWQIVYVHNNFRGYVFIVLADPSVLTAQKASLDQVYSTIQLYTPPLFGTLKEQTLTQLGGDPDPQDLDPAQTTTSAGDYVGLLFSGLVRLSPTLQVEPDLAENYTVSSDGKVYTFTLQANLKFTSGRPITAQDVKDSWERAADPKTKSSTASTYLGDIVGVKDKLKGAATSISGVRVIDDRTLEVTLDGPKAYFLAKLTYPTAFVEDVTQISGTSEDWVWQANASGPYKIKEYKKDEYITFERNMAYYAPPSIPTLLYIFHPGGSAISLYEEGTLDIVPLGGDNALRVRKPDDPLHAQWLSTTSLCTGLVQMNNSMPPFDDAKVRIAFAQSIDRVNYVQLLTSNADIPAMTVLPPAMPGFSSNNSAWPYDAAAAKADLAASKYKGNLPTVTLSAAGYGTQGRPDVNALVDMWKKTLGVDVTVEYLDPTQSTTAMRANHKQMVLYGWCADYPDPENFLDVLYHSQSEFNVSGYSNPQVDSLLEQARVEIDPAKRLQIYQEVEGTLLKDAAVIPLDHSVIDVLVKPRVQGFVLSPLSSIDVRGLSLKPSTP